MPIDTLKTNMQVNGKDGLKVLGKNKKVNPKTSIVKLDKNSIPLTVIILPIF